MPASVQLHRPDEAVSAPVAGGPLLVGVEWLAELLHMSARNVRRWRLEGKLPAPLPTGGRRLLWDRKELEAWVAARLPQRDQWEAMRTLGGGSATPRPLRRRSGA